MKPKSVMMAAMALLMAAPNAVNGELKDRRLGALKDLNGYFPFKVPSSKEAWQRRAKALRERILVSQGLLPMPKKTPLNAVIHGRIGFGNYSIEKVYFESFPGFFVTGNLYRPIGRRGLLPAVLCPHGHWADGRFMDNENILKEIAIGAERFENGGRSPLQSRCVQLAKMGCVVFHYDMIGYADCTQIPFALAHRFSKQRAAMNRKKDWGLFSPQAESHLQSVMGLQTWNSIRALDFLETLPEVDSKRLAITGASGGGTQTFILTSIDPRPAVAFPAVMVSTSMQGGCPCENACLLRIGTGNVEIAGLFAPKPLGLSGANDWTKEMDSKGFPELQLLYRIFGKESHVELFANNHFGHNYNYVSRSAMYHWFNHHLDLGIAEPIIEQDFARLSRSDLSVWNPSHPKPKGGEAFEKSLLTYWHEDAFAQISKAAQDRNAFLKIANPAIEAMIGRSMKSAGKVDWEINIKNDRGDYLEMSGLLLNRHYEEAIPVVFLHPKEDSDEAILWLHPDGKKGLYEKSGKPIKAVRRLLEKGISIVLADLLYQGESLINKKRLDKTRSVSNPREVAAYTFGYNHSVFAKRIHDVLSIVKFLKTHEKAPQTIGLIALKGAGHWAAVARSVLGDAIDHYAMDTGGFRFGEITNIHDPDFLPGGAKYLDLPGFLIAGELKPLWLAGENAQTCQTIFETYAKSETPNDLVFHKSELKKQSAVDWFLNHSNQE